LRVANSSVSFGFEFSKAFLCLFSYYSAIEGKSALESQTALFDDMMSAGAIHQLPSSRIKLQIKSKAKFIRKANEQ